MRLKKGSVVEVLSEEASSRSWRCAEIMCGNGHKYTVKYDVSGDGEVYGRVPRKAIRPCPPPVEGFDKYVPGEVIEVFHNFSWKMASVSKVLLNCFLVRLIGYSQEFKANKAELRVRQSWENDRWVMIGKCYPSREDEKLNVKSIMKTSKQSSFQVQQTDGMKLKLKRTPDHFSVKDGANFQESRLISSRTLKRGSPCNNSQAEPSAGPAKKFRMSENEGWGHQTVSSSPFYAPKMVDAINNRSNGFPKMDLEHGEQNGATKFLPKRNLEHSNADSITSSVGSCSVNSVYFSARLIDHIDGNSSDAESFCGSRHQERSFVRPEKVGLEEDIHRLELHSYRQTMEAMHALGPLNWERETFLTELRRSLHISNDEHLMEIRNLVSANSSFSLR